MKLHKFSKVLKLLDYSPEQAAIDGIVYIPDNEDNEIELDIDYSKVDFNLEIKEDKKKNKTNDFTIKPIITMDSSYEEPPNDILLKPPFSLLFIGRPGSGKSSTVINLLQWYKGYFDQIFIISPTIKIDSSWITAMENDMIDIDEHNIMTSYNEAAFKKIFNKIKKKNKGIEDYNKKLKCLFIFDDIVGDLPRKQRTIMNTFSRNHRHFGVSHITLSQEYKACPPVMRKNSFGVCLYDSDNLLERQAIVEELAGKIGKGRFERMWNEATKERFNFLFVKQFSNDLQKKYSFKFERFYNPFHFDNSRFMIEEEILKQNKEKPVEEKPVEEEVVEEEVKIVDGVIDIK